MRHDVGTMDAEARERTEQTIRTHSEAGRNAEAVTVALKAFGPEILGYFVAMTKNEADAADAFSLFCEDVWRGLPRFRWASTFRTWAYTVARHALSRMVRDPERRRPKVPLSESPELQELAVAVRSTTLLHLRTEVKSRVAALREQLDPDDRTLLILRIDRKLAWQDIARIMAEGDEEPSAAEVAKISAALRKRFERVKERLRKLAKPPEDEA